MKKYKHLLLTFTAVSAIAAPVFLSSCGSSNSESEAEGQDSIPTEELEDIVEINTLTISKVDLDQPTLDEKKGTYSFNASATVDGPGKEKAVVVYTLTKVQADNSNVEVARNEDGKFNEIGGLKEKEIYIIEASVKGSSDVNGEIRLFQENIPMVEKVKKLDAAELTSIIMSYAKGDNTNYEANKDCLTPDCKYLATDGKEYDLGVIAESVSFDDWKSIEFTSVEYDSFNRIRKATFKINYPN